MKIYASTMMLFARSTLAKLLGLLVVTGLAETGLFYLAMDPNLPLEVVFAESHLSWVSAVAFGLWLFVLPFPPSRRQATPWDGCA